MVKIICTFLIQLLIVGLATCGIVCQANDEFEEGKYEVVDTGLEQTIVYGPGVLGEWLDDRRILLNALQDSPNAQEMRLDRVVIFDTTSQKYSVLLPSSSFICRNPNSKIARIVTNGIDNFIKLDDDGKFSAVAEAPRWDKFLCSAHEPLKPDRLQAFLREGDGYIDRGKAGGGYSRDNATLYRPNRPPVELPVIGGNVGSIVYISRLKRYLLGSTDYLSGDVLPAGKPVFNLMTSDGEITEIPQPAQFVKMFGGFAGVQFMRDGMLVFGHMGPNIKNPGMFFLKEGKVIRIFGADKQFASRVLSSPDGCTLAFLSFKDTNFTTSKKIKLINLCKEK
ncbi:hypothetical protein GN109_10925 [Collimonas pratensis]|uniref:hypothetical protein n=1 Tax=Collimonas pratensis TaxID=279113 RepID=UPI00143D7124|nr:hypothetical protein [Collimonas pratensis]NKI69934.1 hypothetical protein [Collimonas pratensis]